jgi:hypothetical protein
MERGEVGYFPKPEDLSDKDFVRAYPKNGFGWVTGTDADKEILDRHAKLQEEKPEIYTEWYPANEMSPSSESEPQSDERPLKRNLMPRELTRNLNGQVVNPKTNEPVRRGSPEWQELAKRNMLPLDQEGRNR